MSIQKTNLEEIVHMSYHHVKASISLMVNRNFYLCELRQLTLPLLLEMVMLSHGIVVTIEVTVQQYL